jgi:hypothetical protein
MFVDFGLSSFKSIFVWLLQLLFLFWDGWEFSVKSNINSFSLWQDISLYFELECFFVISLTLLLVISFDHFSFFLELFHLGSFYPLASSSSTASATSASSSTSTSSFSCYFFFLHGLLGVVSLLFTVHFKAY